MLSVSLIRCKKEALKKNCTSNALLSASKREKICKWPDLPYSIPPIDCCVRINRASTMLNNVFNLSFFLYFLMPHKQKNLIKYLWQNVLKSSMNYWIYFFTRSKMMNLMMLHQCCVIILFFRVSNLIAQKDYFHKFPLLHFCFFFTFHCSFQALLSLQHFVMLLWLFSHDGKVRILNFNLRCAF